MPRAETSDGKSRSNGKWRRTLAPPTADGVPRMTSGTVIRPTGRMRGTPASPRVCRSLIATPATGRECGAYVAHQSLILGTLDGRAAEEAAVTFLGQCSPVGDSHRQQFTGRGELWHAAGGDSVIVRADHLACVAAIYAVAEAAYGGGGERAAMLDRLAREAAARVQTARGDECARRTGGKAGRATAATVIERCAGRDDEVTDYRTEECHRPHAGDDEVAALAHPAEAGTPCPVTLHEGRSVTEAPALHRLPGKDGETRGKLCETRPHHIMIVAAIGIARNAERRRRLHHGGTVGQCHDDARPRTGHEERRVETLVDVG